jgi:hypothetical protein
MILAFSAQYADHCLPEMEDDREEARQALTAVDVF